MFHDTSSAMQLAMQGYSNSINVHGQKGLGNAFRDSYKSFSQGLHDQQDLEQKRQANEYGQKTMDDRVGMMKEQHEGMKLSNEFDRRTMEDRVMQESHRTKGLALDNTGKRIQNNTNQMHYNDLKYQQKARNDHAISQYEEDTSRARLGKTETELARDTYRGVPIVKYGDNYYTSVTKNKNGSVTLGTYIPPAEAEKKLEYNKKIEQNKQMTRNSYTGSYHNNIAQQNANIAQATLSAQGNDTAFKYNQERQEAMKGLGTTEFGAAQQQATTGDAGYYTDSTGNRHFIGSPIGYSQSGAGTTNAFPNNINLTQNTKPHEAKLQSVESLRQIGLEVDGMDDAQKIAHLTQPQNMQKLQQGFNNYVQNTNSNDKNKILESLKNIASYGDVIDGLEIVKDERLNVVIGEVGKYLNLDSGQMNALAQFVKNSSSIEGMKEIRGAASNYDARKVDDMSYKMLAGSKYNGEILRQMYKKQLHTMNEVIARVGGTPEMLLGHPDGKRLYQRYLIAKSIASVPNEVIFGN